MHHRDRYKYEHIFQRLRQTKPTYHCNGVNDFIKNIGYYLFLSVKIDCFKEILLCCSFCFFVFSREDQIDERKIHNWTQKSINLHIFFIKMHACLIEIWFFSITIRIENSDCKWTTAQFHNGSINSNKLCKSTDNLSLDHLLIWWTPSLRNFVTKWNSLNMWNS